MVGTGRWLVLVSFLWLSGAVALTEYRLGTELLPQHYKLVIKPNFEDFTFQGELVLEMTCVENVAELVLNKKELDLEEGSIRLEDVKGGDLGVGRLLEDSALERMVLIPVQPFLQGHSYRLSLSYRGLINDQGWGFYRSSYVDHGGKTRYFGVTQLRPVHARRVFPCFDEPIFRANFKLEIIHDSHLHAISNMPKESVNPLLDTKAVTKFEVTPKIPPFLVAFMVSDLAGVNNGSFSGWSVPEKVEGVRWAAAVGPGLAAAMQEHTGLLYNLVKTDVVALPRLVPVAMENWGLFSFRETFSLYFPGESKTLQKQDVARFMGHELAHCWMGNPTSIAWWDYLWLSEVFAMYYEYYMPTLVYPSWRMTDQMVVDLHQAGLQMDAKPQEPLTTSVLTPQQISAKFSGLTYSKGPALLRMVIHAMTEPQFLKGFRKFLTDNSYSSVEPSDLWNTLNEFGTFPTHLNEIMSNWTDVSGYPVLNVTRDYFTGDVFVSQSTFQVDSPESTDSKSWWVPISYTTKDVCDFRSTLPKIWISGRHNLNVFTVRNPSAKNWLILNIQSTGFYRTNYDLDNWNSLIEQLRVEHKKIHLLNRAQLLSDSFNLARGGRLSYDIPLRLGRYLTKERDFVVWSSAFRSIAYLDNTLIHSPIYRDFVIYMKSILEGVYKEVGFEESGEDSHLTRLKRELVVDWACRMGNVDCGTKSVNYVLSLGPQSKTPNKISVDVKETALCTGVSRGGPSAWAIVMSLFANAKPDFTQRYLNALSCTQSLSNVHKFLVDSLNELSEPNWSSRFTAFASRKHHAEALLQILFDERQTITKRFGADNYSKYVNQLGEFLTTRKHWLRLAELEAVGVLGLSNTKTAVAGRASWLDTYSQQLAHYLKPAPEKPLIFHY